MSRILSFLVVTTALAAQWPIPKSATEAYDFIQDRRAKAESLWQKKDPGRIDILLSTLPYLDQPLVRDLSAGNRYLAARRINIEIDLAQAYAVQGNKAKTFEYLRKVVTEEPLPSLTNFINQERAFNSVRDDPEFAKILSGFRIFDSLWDSPALKTPYKENINDAEKLAVFTRE